MNTKQLSYIVEIAKWGNMTKAAQELYVAQSALSQYLTRLEDSLGVSLFVRSKNAMLLTPEGELYVEAAKKMIQIQEDLYDSIASMNRDKELHVCFTSSFGQHMLSRIIPIYKEQFPDTKIILLSCHTTDVLRLLDEDSFGLALAASNDPCEYKLPHQTLRKEEILFGVSKNHPYVSVNLSDQMELSDMAVYFSDTNFICSQSLSTIARAVDPALKRMAFKPNIFCYADKLQTVRKLIMSNNGAGFIPESCSSDRAHIKYYSVTPQIYRLNVAVHKKNWPKYQFERCFYDMVVHYFKEHPERPYIAEADSL